MIRKFPLGFSKPVGVLERDYEVSLLLSISIQVVTEDWYIKKYNLSLSRNRGENNSARVRINGLRQQQNSL